MKSSSGMARKGHGQSAFRLEDQTAHWGGPKLWRLVFDLPGEKVNKLSQVVMEEFGALLGQLEGMASSGQIDALVVVSGKKGNFIAGADIEMIQSVTDPANAAAMSQAGQALANRWEDLPFPTVAAIDGAALGGGFELCLASSAIVMSDDPAARVGLPEVMLGLIPGMGGCVRLPRKGGIATALDLILTGKTLSADRAFRGGLVEAALPRQNFEYSVFQWTRANLPALQSGKRLAKEPKLGGMGGSVGTLMEKTPMGRNIILKKAREQVLSRTKGHYPAPLEALEVIRETGGAYGSRIRGAGRDQAMAREAQGFGKLVATDVSKNLIRIFFLTEAVKKSKGLLPGEDAVPHAVDHAAVLGAGVMGGGIAQLFAEKEIPTRMKDLNDQALSLGIKSASAIFQKQVQKKKINRRQYLQKLNFIAPVLDFSGFGSTDLVVEAIIENLEIKQKTLVDLEGHVKPDCVIASNTSSLSVTKMQSVMKQPQRFGGMHFFNPVHKMPLVEVIRGEQTSNEAVSSIFQFSKRLGKTPIVVKDAPGFLVNRLLAPYLNEASYLLGEGVPIEEIDRILLEFGMPMGPMELIDEVGIDVGVKVAHILHDAFGDRMVPSEANEKIVASGRLGKKNGKGLYAYSGKGGKSKAPDTGIYELLGIRPKHGAVSDEEILDRCILPMINEATRCLEEKIVATAADVDLGMIMGTGFPPFRGGLLRYADTLGAREVSERLRKYEPRFGKRFEPSPSLRQRAERNLTFY